MFYFRTYRRDFGNVASSHYFPDITGTDRPVLTAGTLA